MFFYKLSAFIKRDLMIYSSYRLSYLFELFGILSSLFTFYFISKLMGVNSLLTHEGYGEDYFSFVIIGIAFSRYQSAALGVGNILNSEQDSGTLEQLLLTPTGIFTIITAGSFYQFIETSVIVFAYLFIGGYFFNMPIGDINILSTLIIIALSIASFIGIGLIASSFTLVFKRGDPIAWFFSGASKFLGGVFFPVTILPVWVQKISGVLPITYSLIALRDTILKGKGVLDVRAEAFYLSLFAAIFLPIGIFSLKYAIKRCKKDGSLIHV